VETLAQLRFWDDQCIAYDRQSGDTHLLSMLAGRVLLCAWDGTQKFDDLVDQTAHATGIEPDDAFVASVQYIVTEMQTKGLLSLTCCSPN
jgi:PqqD family protein of HPr-rel-A system